MPLRLLPFLACLALALPFYVVVRDDQDERTVGRQADGRVLVPTNQFLTPAGVQVEFPGRPVDLAVLPESSRLVVKNKNDLTFIDLSTGQVTQTLTLPKEGRKQPGFSVTGLAVSKDRVFASDAENQVREAVRQPGGRFVWGRKLPLQAPAVKGEAHPAGLAWQSDKELWVCSTRGNQVQLLDLERNEVKAVVPVGVAPFGVLADAAESTIYVSNWGGDPPAPDQPQGVSSETPLRIDPRTGVANHGSVSVVKRTSDGWRQVRSIPVGLHPCALAKVGRTLFVANANSDTVSVIDTQSGQVTQTLSTRLEHRLPFGSGPCALAADPSRRRLYVANATNNAALVLEFDRPLEEAAEAGAALRAVVKGALPTGWYPAALALAPDGTRLAVANLKGVGSLAREKEPARGKTSGDHLGSVSLVPLPSDTELTQLTEQVKKNNRHALALAGLEPPDPKAKPQPVPRRHGEPSVFKHVIYIIKENRTYDQVFGDMKEGRGMPELCIYGERITPNQHALAREFTLFDNFYCSGVLSADGHTWVNEAYVTDYIERSFGGFTRSYPDDGADPLAYAEFGFLWDNALTHQKTIRNYGEYVSHENEPKDATWFDHYADHRDGTSKVKVKATANVPALKPHTHPGLSWWPPVMPDVHRAKLFIEELKEFEKKGALPNLIYIALPCNHAMGLREDYPTPRAMVADNDLAVGQIVEAVSESMFWPETCIFVVEDDPQDGFDHVDAHRTVAQAISPYTKRGHVDRTNYNQTGMVKTIELILGLPPMNQMDLAATPMRHCFASQPDLRPYRCRPANFPLDERNPKRTSLSGEARKWAEASLRLNLDQIDAAEEDSYNRILWFAAKGPGAPYPSRFTRQGRDEGDD